MIREFVRHTVPLKLHRGTLLAVSSKSEQFAEFNGQAGLDQTDSAGLLMGRVVDTTGLRQHADAGGLERHDQKVSGTAVGESFRQVEFVVCRQDVGEHNGYVITSDVVPLPTTG